MADDFTSPVDIEASADGLPGLGQLAVALGLALILLGLFNAHALAAWADGLTPGPRTAPVAAAAHDLADRLAARGLDTPRAVLHDAGEQAKAARWPGQADQR
jgi:hypothetical protein